MNQTSSTTTRRAMTALAVTMLIVAALLPLPLRAQSFYGSIVGTVTDTSGAVVADASVTVTNIATGKVEKAQTDAGGKYSVADLLPANYKVAVEKTNFKRIEREGVTVEVGAVVRIDLALAVGEVSQTVQVTGAVPLLQTDTSSLNQEVEGDVVQQMPLNGRNVLNLMQLAPGVVAAGSASGSTGLDQSSGRTGGGIAWNNYLMGGAIQGWSAEYIDGTPNQLYGDNIVSLVPTQDAIQEFNVVSSDATADYGRFAGGVVTMTTKRGGNAFHGSAWEYLRNADFNANGFFNNQAGLPRPQWNQNQYGAAVNGPIKKDKAFFMFTWENFKILTAVTNTDEVPTQAMQNGTLNHNFGDPRGDCNIVNNGNGTYSITNLYGPAAAGGLDSTCGDPLNRVLKEYWPLPNTPAGGTKYNWALNSPDSNTQTQYNGRVDYNISSKDSFFARYSWWTVQDGFLSVFGDVGSPAYGSSTPTKWDTASPAAIVRTQQGVLGNTYTLNPTTVLNVRASYNRQFSGSVAADSNVNQAQFDQYNTSNNYTKLSPQMQAAGHTLPEITVSGGDNLYAFGSVGNYNLNYYDTYSLNADLTKILGAHTLKVGVEARLMDNSGTPYAGGSTGYYTYSTAFSTSGPTGSVCTPTAGASCAGDEFASFLMGYPEGSKAAYFQTYQNTAGYSYYQGYYVMDDWQATRKLTLNLGLRYELPGAAAERNNKLAVLLPNATDPNTGITGTEGLVGGSLYHPRTAIVEQYNLFAPRVGLAYRATENTVVHGGYGLSYIPDDLSGFNGFGTLPFLSAFNAALTSEPAPSGAVPLQDYLGCLSGNIAASTCTTYGYSQVGLVQPPSVVPANFMQTLNLASSTSYKGQSLEAPVPYQSYPYVQQWNAALSHQFKSGWMVEASYSGLKGTNLPQIGYPPHTYFSLDELHSQYYSMGYALLSAKIGSPAAAAAGFTTCPNTPNFTNPGSITVGQCLRPNPYYSDMEDSARWTAHQTYKALQITTEKRFGSDGVLNANYTYSKDTSDTDTANQQLENTSAPKTGDGVAGLQDYNNLGAEYSLISYDVKNRLVLDYVLSLPFGKGQKYANSLNDLGNAFASGWAINGITTFQSGFPIFIQSATTNFLTSNMGAGILRPSVVPGCNKQVGGGSATRVLAGAWFNTACFVQATTSSDTAGQVTFGNEPRVDPDLREDGIKNFDFAFQKSTPIWESSNFVFRAEFFNIFNRVQFNPPVNTYAPGSANFGAIVSQHNNPRQIQLSARVNF